MSGNVSYSYRGNTAIVTGSTKGIGRGIARSLSQADANVIINSRTESDVKKTVSELSKEGEGEITGVAADLQEKTGIERLVNEATAEYGTIDILVNNAAVWANEDRLVTASLEDWDYTMDINVRAPFYCSQLVANNMIDNGIKGSIINITSQTGDRRCGNRGLYGISNTAMNGLTWRLAIDLAPDEIRVNSVSTVATETHQLRKEATERAGPNGSMEAELDKLAAQQPMGRLGQPEDIGNAVLYLASESASYVVGTILRVSGGGNLQ